MRRAHFHPRSRAAARLFTAAALLAAPAGCAVTGVPSSAGPDVPSEDASSSSPAAVASGCTPDAGAYDAAPGDAWAPDAAPDAAAEASAPEVTATVASSGSVIVWPDALFAYFFEDNTIVRFAATPECVMHVRSATKGYSAAGNLRVGGDYFGKTGGPPAGGVTYAPGVAPNATPNAYEEILDPNVLFYPATGLLSVLLQTTGTATVPALPVQTLKTPAFATVQVLSPTVPDGGTLAIAHEKPFDVTWTAPAGNLAGQRMVVSISSLAGETHVADVRCGYPLAAGKAEIPALVLTEAWTRLGASATHPLNGAVLRILAGDQREVVVGSASYVLELGRHDGTTFGDELQVTVK